MAPSRRQQIVTGVLMTTVMALALSGFFTLLRVGVTPAWPALWGKSFLMGWPVGCAVSALAAGPVRRLAARIAGGRSEP